MAASAEPLVVLPAEPPVAASAEPSVEAPAEPPAEIPIDPPDEPTRTRANAAEVIEDWSMARDEEGIILADWESTFLRMHDQAWPKDNVRNSPPSERDVQASNPKPEDEEEEAEGDEKSVEEEKVEEDEEGKGGGGGKRDWERPEEEDAPPTAPDEDNERTRPSEVWRAEMSGNLPELEIVAATDEADPELEALGRQLEQMATEKRELDPARARPDNAAQEEERRETVNNPPAAPTRAAEIKLNQDVMQEKTTPEKGDLSPRKVQRVMGKAVRDSILLCVPVELLFGGAFIAEGEGDGRVWGKLEQ